MINPNKTAKITGKIVSIESYTSMTVHKVSTKSGIFDYTTFGYSPSTLVEGDKIDVIIGYSVTLNGCFIKEVINNKAV